MNKTRYFKTENVINYYIHCFISPMKIVSTGTHVLWAIKADFKCCRIRCDTDIEITIQTHNVSFIDANNINIYL